MSKQKIIIFLLLLFSIFFFWGRTIVSQNIQVSINLISFFDNENEIEILIPNKKYGSKFSFSNDLNNLEGYEFVYWVLNDVVRSDLTLEHEFVITSNMNLVGVFKETGTYAVLFRDSNGKLLDVKYVVPSGSVSDSHLLDSLPSKPGYIISPTNRWSSPLTNIQKDTVLTLQYVKINDDDYSVVVFNGDGDGLYAYNTYATVTADSAPHGLFFSHWQIGNQIVGYNPTHTFTVLSDGEIRAVYTEKEYMDSPWIALGHGLNIREGYTSFVGQFHLPVGYDLIEFGMLSSTTTQDLLTFDTQGVNIHQGSMYNIDTFEWLRSFVTNQDLNVRAYLVYENEFGHIITLYSSSETNASSEYANDLIISEYGEGSSNNKWIEIYNGTGSDVVLSNYDIRLYVNGATSPSSPITLSGTISHGETYVIAHSSANATILSLANLTSGSLTFNGNDPVGLFKNSVLVDIVGPIGSAADFAKDTTLVRKPDIIEPTTNWNSNDWLTFSVDSTANLGLHQMNLTSSKSIVAISSHLDIIDYSIGDYIDLTSATIIVYYDDLSKETMPMTTDMVTYFSTDSFGYHYGIIDYHGFREIIFYDVDKLIPTYTTPILSDVVFVEGMRLSDIALPSGFTWADESILLSLGAKNYDVIYTPLDTEQYHIVSDISVAFNVVETATPLIIYEVYGGGGNSGATYTHDYIVIYNTTNSNIDLTGYSVQYAAATSSTYTVISLSGVIYHKSFYLIQLASGGAVGAALPVTPSLTHTLNMAQTSGKVALVASTSAIVNMNDENVIDFLGYGSTANEYEGTKTATLSSSLSAKRSSFIDTNDNGADFSVATPNLTYLESNLTVVDVIPMYIKVYYEIGDALDISNAVLTLVFNSGASENIPLEPSMVSGFDSSQIGIYQLTIVYGEFTMTYEYYVIDYSDLDQVVVHYIDIGELGGQAGEAALIQVAGIDVLIDSGNNDSSTRTALMGYLDSVITDGVIEYIIATHPDADHIGNFIEVFNTYTVQNVIQYSTTGTGSILRGDYEAAALASGAQIIDAYTLATSTSAYISLSQGIGMQFYNTNYLVSSTNNASSIVFVLEALNTRILFTGDAEGNQEAVYAPLVGDVDIFRLGHHGALAGTTSFLLETITPEVAIVTNGNYLGNQHSHPTYGAVARIYEYSHLLPVYAVTGGNGSGIDRMHQRNGHIWIDINPNGYDISSKFYGDNPIELSATDYWQDASNGFRHLGYYYAFATGISSGFEAALHHIIKGHTSFSYAALWEKLRITDENPANNSHVLLLYTGRSQSKMDNGGDNDQWNREHVWPNSHGIYDATPAYTDLHHIRATDVYVNNVRGNLDFGLVTHSLSSKVINAFYGDNTYGLGSSFSYVSSSYFEPRDEVKGDVARMLFYMAVRYQGTNGEPNLQLINGTTSINTPFLGDLNTLLLWHVQDPVDEHERNRNDAIYSLQGNRNPFIDMPDYVTRVFGG